MTEDDAEIKTLDHFLVQPCFSPHTIFGINLRITKMGPRGLIHHFEDENERRQRLLIVMEFSFHNTYSHTNKMLAVMD